MSKGGNGHTLDGRGHGPILTVGLATTVVIEQLTLSNGQTGECGGAILVYGDLTLRQSQVQHSFAERGGGICELSDGGQAAVRLEESRVSDNAARYGGGIYVRSSGGGVGLGNGRAQRSLVGNRNDPRRSQNEGQDGRVGRRVGRGGSGERGRQK